MKNVNKQNWFEHTLRCSNGDFVVTHTRSASVRIGKLAARDTLGVVVVD